MPRKIISVFIILTFLASLVTPVPQAQAQALLGLPEPGRMVSLSPAFEPTIIKGMTIHKNNPFMFDFIVDPGQDNLQGNALKSEGERLIKYFLAGLAIPEKDLWVNLSPFEKTRIVPPVLGRTAMGRDLLAEDYLLKQITASLIYPERALGKTFWDKVYSSAWQRYGTSEVPVNTFNKVWIMADSASVFEHGQTAFVTKCHLKVMLEEDYLALGRAEKEQNKIKSLRDSSASPQNDSSYFASQGTPQKDSQYFASQASPRNDMHAVGSKIIKEIILPALEREVNTGKNFANLRQIFNSLILAAWFKRNFHQALINEFYSNKEKTKGIDLNDPTIKEKIYRRYLQAYKKGVFNFIKEDLVQGQTIPRKYFSGGIVGIEGLSITKDLDPDDVLASMPANRALIALDTSFKGGADAAMPSEAANEIIVSKVDQPYSLDRKVRTKYSRTLENGKYELLSLREVREKYELWKVVKSRDPQKLGLTWGDGEPIKNDSFWYGEDEFGKSAKKGRFPDWIYVLKPKADSGLDEDDLIYAGDYDIRHTFPQNECPQQYRQIERKRGDKEEQIDAYERKVEDMRRMVVLFHDEISPETLDMYEKDLLPEVDSLKGTVGVGDPSFETINTMYALFAEEWKKIYKGKNDVTMENFFLAWNSFKEGNKILNTSIVRRNGMPGVITNIPDILFIIQFVRNLNRATEKKPAQVEGAPAATPLPGTETFWDDVDRITALFKNIELIANRLGENRRRIGRGQRPLRPHADDMNRDGYVDAINLVADDLLREFSDWKGEPADILVAHAQGGVLRKRLKVISPDLNVRVIDMDDSYDEGVDDDSPVLEASLDNVDHKTFLPVIGRRTAAAKGIDLSDLHPKVIVAAHVFNQYRTSGPIGNALRAIIKLNPDLVYISTPEGTLLARTPFVKALAELGYDPLRYWEGAFEFTPAARDALRERIKAEMRQTHEAGALDALELEDEVERRMLKAERTVQKRIHWGAYARVRPSKPINLSNLKMTKKIIETGGGTTRTIIRGVLNWDYLRNFSNIVRLGDNAKEMDPQDSTRIYKKNDSEDPEVKAIDGSLDALQAFLHFRQEIPLNFSHDQYRQWEAALNILKIWDEDPDAYLMHAEKMFIENFMRHFGIKEELLWKIIPKESSAPAWGPLDVLPAARRSFYEALGEPHAGVYSIADIYTTMASLGLDEAMVSQERDHVRKRWEDFIANALMGQGTMPSAAEMLANMGPNQRVQRLNLRMFFNITNPSSRENPNEQLKRFVARTVEATKRAMEDKILDAIGVIEANADPQQRTPTLERVAAELAQNYPYFSAWHERLKQTNETQSPSASLQEWIEKFHNGDVIGLGIKEEPVHKEIPPEIKEQIQAAVQAVKAKGDGLMPDADSVGAVLYNDELKSFREFVDQRKAVSPELKPGDIFADWVRSLNPEMDDDRIYMDLDVFVPSQELKDWKKNEAITPNKVYRKEIGKSRGFEYALTGHIRLHDKENRQKAHFPEIYHKVSVDIAKIRYLWDTMKVDYLTRIQLDILEKSLDIPMPMTGPSASSPIKTPITVTGNLRLVMLNQIIRDNGGPQFDIFAYRPHDNGRLCAIRAIIGVRNTMRGTQGQIDFLIEKMAGARIMHQNVHLTLTVVARALAYFNDKVSAQELKEWFNSDFIKSYGIKMGDLGIEDDLWPQGQAQIRKAVAEIKEAFPGEIPNIGRVGERLKALSPEFDQWAKTHPDKTLADWIRQNDPDLTDYEILATYGIYVPQAEDWAWEKFREKMAFSRASDPDKYFNFDIDLTVGSWFFGQLSDQDLLDLKIEGMDLQKIKRLRMQLAKARFLMDTRKIDFVMQEQMDMFNEIELFNFGGLPASFRKSLTGLERRTEDRHLRDLAHLLGVPPERIVNFIQDVRPQYRRVNILDLVGERLKQNKASEILSFRPPAQRRMVLLGFLTHRRSLAWAQYVVYKSKGGFSHDKITEFSQSSLYGLGILYPILMEPNFQSYATVLTLLGDSVTPRELEAWIEANSFPKIFLGGDFIDAGLMQKAIKEAVAEVKQDGKGLVPDIYRVAAGLKTNTEFETWVKNREAAAAAEINPDRYRWLANQEPGMSDEQIRHRAARGELLEAWIKYHEPALSDDQIFLRFGLFVPTEADIDWQAQEQEKASRGLILTKQELRSAPEFSYLEMILTMESWFFDSFDDEFLLKLKLLGNEPKFNRNQIQKDRLLLARLRFLWDTMGVSYLEKSQIRDLKATKTARFEIPPEFKERPGLNAEAAVIANFLREMGETNEGRIAGFKKRAEMDTSIADLFYEQTRMEGHRMPRDPFVIRSLENRRIAKISYLFHLRAATNGTSAQIKNIYRQKTVEEVMKAWKKNIVPGFFFWNMMPIFEVITFDTLAQALRNMGDDSDDVSSGANLREWFRQSGISPELFGVKEVPSAAEAEVPQDAETPELTSRPTAQNAWAEAKVNIQGAVEALKDSHVGGINSFNVGLDLYGNNRNGAFVAWVNEKIARTMNTINPQEYRWVVQEDERENYPEGAIRDQEIRRRVAMGQLLVSWIKHNDPGISDDEIFFKYNLFVPGETEKNWDAAEISNPEKDRSNEITMEQLKRDPDTNFVQGALTNAIWFFGYLNDKNALDLRYEHTIHERGKAAREQMRILYTDIAAFRAEKLAIAQLQFLIDNQGAQHINKKQYDLLKEIDQRVFETSSLPEGIRNLAGFQEDQKIIKELNEEAGKQMAPSFYRNLTRRITIRGILKDITPKSDNPFKKDRLDPFLVRPERNRRIAKISYLINLRTDIYFNFFKWMKLSNRELNPKVVSSTLASIKNPRTNTSMVGPMLEVVTFDTLAASLSLIGDKINGTELKQWLADNGISKDLFRIYDDNDIAGWERIGWAHMESQLKAAAQYNNNDGSGLMPTTNSVGAYLFEHDLKFRVWVENQMLHKTIENLYFADALLAWFKEFRPELNVEKDLPRLYGIYVPNDMLKLFERNKAKANGIFERKDFSSPKKVKIIFNGIEMEIDLREFEARLTAFIWFTNLLSDEQLRKLFPGLRDEEGQRGDAHLMKRLAWRLRFLWDTMKVSYLPQGYIGSLYFYTEGLGFNMEDLPESLTGRMERIKANIPTGREISGKVYNILTLFDHRIEEANNFYRSPLLFENRPDPDGRRLAAISTLILGRNLNKKIQQRASGTVMAKVRTVMTSLSQRVVKLVPQLRAFRNTDVPLNLENISSFMTFVGVPMTPEELGTWFDSDFVKNKQGITLESLQYQDEAMTALHHQGGINLNTSRMTLNVTKEGTGVEMNIDPALLARMEREGIDYLTPVIVRMRSVKSIWPLLGLQVPPS